MTPPLTFARVAPALLAGAFAFAAPTAAAAKDPCALREHVDKPSAELALLVDKAPAGRARACLLVVRANALSREGKGTDAAALFDAALPALPEFASFLELAKKRATSAPPAPVDEKPPASADEAADIVSRLVKQAKPRRAAEIAVAFPRAKDSVHEPLESVTLSSLVRADRMPEALARSAQLPSTDMLLKTKAWVFGKAKQLDQARDSYAALAAQTSDPQLKAEAAFLAGFTAYEKGDCDDAKARLAVALPLVKETPWDASTRWYTALCDLLRGKHKDAVPVLEKLVAELPSDRELLKHRYWLARARIESGDAARGKRELAALADNEVIEFYGLLARRRLQRKPLQGAKVAADAMAKLARNDADAGVATALWQLGLDDEARTVARGLGETAADIGVQHRVGDVTFGWRRGARFLPWPRTSGGKLVNDARWRVSYATPWRSEVDAAARKHGVTTSFMYAIMRTESGFDPRAVSVAGALGAMQLLPSAARGSAKLAGRSVDDARRIFEAPVAIDLGAALLAQGQREFGSMMLSAAAYNGAAPNVVEWMRAHRALEVELFIERIPFKETRDYVKRVLAVEATYRALDGGALSLDIPDAIPEPPEKPTHFPMDE